MVSDVFDVIEVFDVIDVIGIPHDVKGMRSVEAW